MFSNIFSKNGTATNGLKGQNDLKQICSLPFASLQPAVNFYSGTIKSYLLVQYISVFLLSHKQQRDDRDSTDLKGLPVSLTLLWSDVTFWKAELNPPNEE